MNFVKRNLVLLGFCATILLQAGCAAFKQPSGLEPSHSVSEQLFKEREQPVSGWGCFLEAVGPFLQLLACLNR